MQKATISARSGRMSGGSCAFEKRAKPDAKSDDFGAVWTHVRRQLRLREACKTRCKKRRFRRGLDACPEAVAPSRSVQNPMQKATISARSGRRSGGCCAFEKRAKPDAESDDFGAVWTQVRRLLRLREACKTRCRKR